MPHHLVEFVEGRIKAFQYNRQRTALQRLGCVAAATWNWDNLLNGEGRVGEFRAVSLPENFDEEKL